MLARKKVKIIIVSDKKQLAQYISSICDESAYKNFEFEIKAYTSPGNAILELPNDLDIMILDYFANEIDGHEIITGKKVIEAIQNNCKDCHTIVTSDIENTEQIAVELSRYIYRFVDTSINSSNRIGATVQEILQQLEPIKQK
jgi:PleD family two-component response regulator